MDEIASGLDDSPWLSATSWWMPKHYPVSAWVRHAPFAFWIVDALRPSSVVELGTHWGFSYFAMCEAIARLGLPSTAFALDTWVGEEHAGRYGEEVYAYVSATNDADYSSFSTLLRGFFDDSLGAVADGSVDLLHIDGRHGYDDVKHDFESWLPKLSERGVVLFHDTEERKDDFGVWQFWAEISETYPSFGFEHEHGLGVLGVGERQAAPLARFFEAARTDGDRIRADYSRLGEEVSRIQSWSGLPAQLAAEREERAAQVQRLETEIRERDDLIVGLGNQLDEVHASTSWKLTRPLRRLTGRLRKS